MLLSLLTSLIISAAMFLFGKNILSLFISGEPQQTHQVLAIAFKYLSIMAAMLWVLYFLYVYRSALQGLGDTLMPMVSGIAEFVMRTGRTTAVLNLPFTWIYIIVPVSCMLQIFNYFLVNVFGYEDEVEKLVEEDEDE